MFGYTVLCHGDLVFGGTNPEMKYTSTYVFRMPRAIRSAHSVNHAISSGQREGGLKVVDIHTIHVDSFLGPQDANQDMLSFAHPNERYVSEPNTYTQMRNVGTHLLYTSV